MTHRWYVIRSKPRKEEFLAEQMELRRIGIFNPCIRVQVVNPRARKVKPYFPGTVFAHMDLEKAGTFSMQTIPGAAGLVTFGGKAADVPDGMIHAIRQRGEENNNTGAELFDALRMGETVLIHSGPFAGYEAIFDARLPSSDRVRVLLKLLNNRQMPVDLPAGHIRPKKQPRLTVR